MHDWLSLYARPDAKEASWTYELVDLYSEISIWLKHNAKKSTRVKIIDRHRAVTVEKLNHRTGSSTFAHLQIKFRSERDLILFKMFFSEYLLSNPSLREFAADSVILPLIRRAMPNIIANQLIGVQSMTAPTGLVFGLTPQYGTPLSKTLSPQTPAAKQSMLNKVLENTKKELERIINNG